MNKIYKVLWNEAKHACVVVSELAKNHGKKSESKLAVLTLAAAVTMSGLGGAVALANSDTKRGRQRRWEHSLWALFCC